MTKIVGILNITPDSFSDSGEYFDQALAAQRAVELFEEGADIVDIGAVSTRYGATLIDHEEEWQRLEPVLAKINRQYISRISIDTFNPETAQKALALGVGMINDVAGATNLCMLEIIAANPAIKYVMMYSLTLPADRSVRAKDRQEIYDFGQSAINKALKSGIQKEQLIFDPGIGFVTDSALSFQIIKDLAFYNLLNIPLYIGHSRKSFLESVSVLPPAQRDIETLTASIYMMMQGIAYLRVHNVAMHVRARNVIKELLS